MILNLKNHEICKVIEYIDFKFSKFSDSQLRPKRHMSIFAKFSYETIKISKLHLTKVTKNRSLIRKMFLFR